MIDKKWLDGPRLVEWLLEKGVPRSHPDETIARAIFRWSVAGARANVFAVDAHLTALGLHLCEVPEDLYCDPSPRVGGQNAYSKELKAQILKEAAKGIPSPALSKRFGVAPGTINTWKREAA